MSFVAKAVSAPSEMLSATIDDLQIFGSAGSASVAGEVASSASVDWVLRTAADGDVCGCGHPPRRTHRPSVRGRSATFLAYDVISATPGSAAYRGHKSPDRL